MTPYELGILLDVHCGTTIKANPAAPIFADTIADLVARDFIRPWGAEEVRPLGLEFASTEKLRVFMECIFLLPDPVWSMP